MEPRINLFAAMRERMAWLGQRQQVLAENIANANTPGYAAKDLAPSRFTAMLAGAENRLTQTVTDAAHINGRAPHIGSTRPENLAKPNEIALDGNAVSLEEQLVRQNQSALEYQMVAGLYQKFQGLIKAAIGRNAG